MAQWANLQQIEKFVNRMRLYITCEKSGGLHLAEPGLTAGWPSVCLADEIWARLEILKACCTSISFLPRYCIVWCISNAFFRQTLIQGYLRNKV